MKKILWTRKEVSTSVKNMKFLVIIFPGHKGYFFRILKSSSISWGEEAILWIKLICLDFLQNLRVPNRREIFKMGTDKEIFVVNRYVLFCINKQLDYRKWSLCTRKRLTLNYTVSQMFHHRLLCCYSIQRYQASGLDVWYWKALWQVDRSRTIFDRLAR